MVNKKHFYQHMMILAILIALQNLIMAGVSMAIPPVFMILRFDDMIKLLTSS